MHVIPVRFVVACGQGHLDDFPWHYWVRHASGCTRPRELTLRAIRAGLAGLVLSCTECGASRSLENIFQRGALGGVRCGGRRPWLAGPNEDCGRELTVLQRGASNLYFPQVVSALDIPPWSDDVQKMLGMYWQPLCDVETGADRYRDAILERFR